MNADLQRLMRRNRSKAVANLERTQRAKKTAPAISNGFKAMVNFLGPVQLRRVVLSRTNMSAAERAYAVAALNRKKKK